MRSQALWHIYSAVLIKSLFVLIIIIIIIIIILIIYPHNSLLQFYIFCYLEKLEVQ